MIEKIRNLILHERSKKGTIIIGSLIGVFLLFGFKGLLLFAGGGAVYHILDNKYGLDV